MRNNLNLFSGYRLNYHLKGSVQAKASTHLLGRDLALIIESDIQFEHGFQVNLFPYLENPDISGELVTFELELNPGLSDQCKMMANGFQSWSRSLELGKSDRQAPVFRPARPLLAPCGDAYFHKYSGKKGHLHSWTYTYFLNPGGEGLFIGSLDERSGYTIFDYDFSSNRLVIKKDCQKEPLAGGTHLLKLYVGSGPLDSLFNEYTSLVNSTRKPASRAFGWCSWYNYYTSVSEDIVCQNLKNLGEKQLPLVFFQVDDGWQKAIGDWLEANEKFPSGMKKISSKICSYNYKPGIWLAPLICVPTSEIYREKPHWLLRDARGKPVRAGYNPGWEGFFYALDFYAPGVQDYLSRVFETVQDHWGYKMLKLDFLYAAALLPREGKSRGRVMCEVIDFIDQHTRDSVILGCGVPLGPAFGKFDYCRIGSDVGPYWEDYLKLLNYPERVSTENSLTCTVGRRHLDKKVFRNDPDVYILRDGKKGINENKLNNDQRYTLFFLNNLLGGLIFTSDNVAELSEDQVNTLYSSFPLTETYVTGHLEEQGLHRFEFRAGNSNYLAFSNLGRTARSTALPQKTYFNPQHFVLPAAAAITVEPYSSICFREIDLEEGKAVFLGAEGHIFPGAQVEEVAIEKDFARVRLHEQASPETKLYFLLPEGKDSLTINGKQIRSEQRNGFNYIVVPFNTAINSK